MEQEYTFTYSGAWLSLNAVYSSNRWVRTKEKNIWKERFTKILTEAQIPALEGFELHVRYNSRMDNDNITGGLKILVDTMRAVGIIKDDNKHIYRGSSKKADLSLPYNTLVITIAPCASTTPTKNKK